MYCTYCGAKNDDQAKTCVQCQVELLPMVSIENMQFNTVSAGSAELFAAHKVGLLDKGDQKKFIKGVEDGTCGTARVRVETRFEVLRPSTDDSDDYDDYANLQTLEKNPISEAIPIVKGFCPEEMSEAVVLRYKLKKNYCYAIVKDDSPDYLAASIKDILGTIQKSTISRRSAATEDSLTGKAKKLFGRMFSKDK